MKYTLIVYMLDGIVVAIFVYRLSNLDKFNLRQT